VLARTALHVSQKKDSTSSYTRASHSRSNAFASLLFSTPSRSLSLRKTSFITSCTAARLKQFLKNHAKQEVMKIEKDTNTT
jgi:hypothetical protein